jgi:hypothetical protein
MKPFKALIVEGTSGVGKSTLIDALIRRHVGSALPRKIRSVVHLAQSHTFGPLAVLEGRGTLTVRANLQHLDRIGGLLQWLHESVQEHTRPWCFVLLDTLHLTHCVRPGVVQWSDVESFDRQLAALGCKLLFLQTAPQTIWQRGIVPRASEQFILEYAQKFGRTHEQIHGYFVREQEILKNLFARSAIPKLLIPNDDPSGDAAERAFHFWNEDVESEKAA